MIIDIYNSFNNEDYIIGSLTAPSLNDDEGLVFEYSDDWLKNEKAFQIAAEFPLIAGKFECDSDKINKTILNCYETDFIDFYCEYFLAYLLKSNLIEPKNYTLQELYNWLKYPDVYGPKFLPSNKDKELPILIDMLYQNDFTRLGSLRFKLRDENEFMQQMENIQLPKITEIETVLAIIDRINNNKASDDEVKKFHACVSGLSGRKPKCNVIDEDGNLWIAKLSSVTDDLFSEFGIEVLGLRLAKKFHLETQEYKIQTTNDGKKYLQVKRYDRVKNERIPILKLEQYVNYELRDDEKIVFEALKRINKKFLRKNLRENFKRKL